MKSQKYLTKVSFTLPSKVKKYSRESAFTQVAFFIPVFQWIFPPPSLYQGFLYSLQLKCLSSPIKKQRNVWKCCQMFVVCSALAVCCCCWVPVTWELRDQQVLWTRGMLQPGPAGTTDPVQVATAWGHLSGSTVKNDRTGEKFWRIHLILLCYSITNLVRCLFVLSVWCSVWF